MTWMERLEPFLAWGDRLYNEHKLMRRMLVLWAMAIITWAMALLSWVAHKVFADLSLITPAVADAMGVIATALATVAALLTVVVGLYQWDRARD